MAGHDLAAIVLAGGQGRRMGEADKGLVLLHGRPMVSWVLDCVTHQVDETIISANRNLDRYETLGFPVLADDLPDFSGPLAGLHSALAVVSRPLWLSVPCDTPFLPKDLASRLLMALLDGGGDVAVPEVDGCLQPAICLGYTRLRTHLGVYLASGGRRVGEWQSQLNRVRVPFSDIESFSNLNTPQELAQAEKTVHIS
ncbi:MAG: molybdenum cofactor guanylyltransferase MobA [Sulfuricellaceae bacterium]|nr:molybdenum cofactor guanylyltransferase MobA [Sulfuricellaceae bacterium]